MKKNVRTLLSTVALPAFALAGAGQLSAAQSDAGESIVTFDEIVVTSRRRSESLQDVPESITAFTAGQIERAGIRNFRDVANLTPNLSQLDNFRPGLARIQIRGLITPQVGDPPLAFVVDGITASDLEFINQDLVDIERIEVLRGAQGALYGRGAIGGAVNIVTKKPGDEFEGNISASYGSGDNVRVGGLVSGPLAKDKAYFRVGGYYRDYGGSIDNAFLNEKADFQEELSVFGNLSFVLSERTSLDVRARFVSTDSGLGYYQGVDATSFEDFDVEALHNVPGLDERDVYEINARLQHDFDAASLELVAGYSKSDQSAFSDADYTSVPSDFVALFAGAQENILTVEAWTFETRLTSASDGPFRWALAAFYQDRQRNSTFNSYDDPVGNARQDRSDFDASQIVFSILDDNSSKAWALSGQVNYDLTDKLEVTGALRYDEDKRRSFDERDIATTDATDTFKQLQPKLSLSYQMADDFLVYTGYSRGFRSGGFNEYSPVINRVFDKEVSDSFELGFKTTLLDGMASLNGAIFRIEQKDAQITRFNVESFTLENISVDDARSQGFELEFAVRPTEALSLFASGGVIDSKVNAFAERPDLIGKSLPHVADYNFNLAAEYETPVSADLTLVMRADMQHTGPRIFNFDIPDVEAGAKTFVGARASLEAASWSLTAYIKNAFNERQVEDLFILGNGVVDLARFPNKPRSYGIEMKYRF